MQKLETFILQFWEPGQLLSFCDQNQILQTEMGILLIIFFAVANPLFSGLTNKLFLFLYLNMIGGFPLAEVQDPTSANPRYY
jgi:hypothetical protein